MSDRWITVALVASFASLMTTHLAIAAGLLFRAPRWRAPLALVVAPLAPYFALRAHMRGRGALWLAAAAIYASALACASDRLTRHAAIETRDAATDDAPALESSPAFAAPHPGLAERLRDANVEGPPAQRPLGPPRSPARERGLDDAPRPAVEGGAAPPADLLPTRPPRWRLPLRVA